MTTEEKLAKLESLKKEAMDYAVAFNDARSDDRSTEEAETHIELAIADYDKLVREMYYDECIASGNPMLAAAIQSGYMTIAARDKKIDGTNLTRKEIVDIERTVDLVKFDKYAGGIGADKHWYYKLQKLNYLMAVRVGKEAGIIRNAADVRKLNDSFAMNEIAREFDMGKTPDSNTGFLRLIQTVVDAMLGEGYKATSHDAGFLDRVYGSKGKKITSIKIPTHANFTKLVLGVLHNLATGCGYSLEYKEVKNPERTTRVIEKVAAAESRRRPPKSAKSGKSAKSEPVSEPASAEVAA